MLFFLNDTNFVVVAIVTVNNRQTGRFEPVLRYYLKRKRHLLIINMLIIKREAVRDIVYATQGSYFDLTFPVIIIAKWIQFKKLHFHNPFVYASPWSL